MYVLSIINSYPNYLFDNKVNVLVCLRRNSMYLYVPVNEKKKRVVKMKVVWSGW
jgi:hypothetical protein